MTSIQCNVCGRDTRNTEVHIEIQIHQLIGYGSRYDGEKIDFDVCAKCVDTILEAISKVCKISPIHIEQDKEVNSW